MALDLHVFRVFSYLLLIPFTIVELGLCAARLHYTLNLPLGDPLNYGRDFYDPIAVELLVASILTLLWAVHAARVIQGRYEYRYGASFLWESIVLFVLFVFWIVGAAYASSIWGDLNWCHMYQPCRILTALLAFAWISWIFVFALLAMNVLFAFLNAAFGEPMHGRWDPRLSHYRDSQGTYPQQSQVQPQGMRRFVPW